MENGEWDEVCGGRREGGKGEGHIYIFRRKWKILVDATLILGRLLSRWWVESTNGECTGRGTRGRRGGHG